MKARIYFTTLLILVVATAIAWYLNAEWAWMTAAFVLIAVVLILFYRSVVIPLNAVQNGIYLLREQDFSSRLRKTGQTDADQVVMLFNSLMDTLKTERLKTQEQNHLLTLLIDASPMGIAICDFDGNIISHNAAYQTLISPDIEKKIASIPDGESITVRSADTQIVRCSNLWFMDSGFRRRFILIERMTDDILQAEKNLFNKIVRTMGHEVNNTLGSVISILDTLSEIHSSDRMLSETIDSGSERCNNLVQFVKGYAEVAKLPPPQPETLDVAAEMERILPFLKLMAGDNITIVLHSTATGIVTSIDPILFERAIVNIVKNSIDSIGASNGSITIKCMPDSIEITDNGPGISAEAAEHIFTPFFSTKQPDRGIGLMLVTEILRAHNAVYSLTTDSETRLTTFRITFRNIKKY